MPRQHISLSCLCLHNGAEQASARSGPKSKQQRPLPPKQTRSLRFVGFFPLFLPLHVAPRLPQEGGGRYPRLNSSDRWPVKQSQDRPMQGVDGLNQQFDDSTHLGGGAHSYAPQFSLVVWDEAALGILAVVGAAGPRSCPRAGYICSQQPVACLAGMLSVQSACACACACVCWI